MLLDQVMQMMEKLVEEIKEAEPAKRDHFLNSTLAVFAISQEALQASTEFRQGFAAVHSEFLKYPECKDVIKQSLEAYQRYFQNKE